MIKAILVDDEQKATETLKMMLEEYCPDIEITGTANSAIEGVKEINSKKPDLVFLDVQMPNGTGFDLLESIPERKFDVIFVTAYNEYAIKAFKYSAIDYILKPVEINELITAVDRFKKNKNIEKTSSYEALLENIKGNKPTKLAIPTQDTVEYVNIEDIIRLEADASYSNVFLANKTKLFVSKNLGEFQNLTEDMDFFRIHKSHIISLRYIKKFHKNEDFVEMTDGSKVLLARRKKQEFIDIMGKYLA